MNVWEFAAGHPVLTVILGWLASMALVGVAEALGKVLRARAVTINVTGGISAEAEHVDEAKGRPS